MLLILGCFLVPVLRGWARTGAIMILPAITLWLVWQVPDGANSSLDFLGYSLHPVTADPLSRLFATIFSIMTFAGGLFALNQNRIAEIAAAFAYAGGAVGVAMAGDLISVFVFGN